MPTYRYPMPPASEITPRKTFLNRRAFIAGGGSAIALAASGYAAWAQAGETLKAAPSPLSTSETQNSLEDIT